MARRPNTGSREQLTQEELAALRKELEEMTLHQLETYYKATHNACSYSGVRVPAPRVIQELVQAWKQLRKVRRGSF
jgi:hypothetical protein